MYIRPQRKDGGGEHDKGKAHITDCTMGGANGGDKDRETDAVGSGDAELIQGGGDPDERGRHRGGYDGGKVWHKDHRDRS